jgi:ABC-2 type transport system permease protein
MFDLRRASMRNVWIIAHREYMERIRTRGFLMTTIMIPLIMGAFVLGTAFLGSRPNREIRIAVVSEDARLARELQVELQRQQQETPESEPDAAGLSTPAKPKEPVNITVEAAGAGPEGTKLVEGELSSGKVDGYLLATHGLSGEILPSFTFAVRGSQSVALKAMLTDSLEKVLLREQLDQRGLNAAEADRLMQPVTLQAVSHSSHKDPLAEEISVSILFFVMYLVIMLYGMNVARSIIEEKTSRIFEVMLATVRPEALMAGKILGVGSVGLTQVGIWLGLLLLLGSSSLALPVAGSTLHLALSGAQLAFFLVYFALGYLLYSAIAAALGAITNSEQELQQMNMFLMLPLLSCFVLLGTMLASPDSTTARVLALVPLFTPLLMYFRVSLGHPAVWEVMLSLFLTSGTICGVVWVSSRIYRVGVLMYGKRPNMGEIRRWIGYS